MFCSCRISIDKRVALSLCHSRASCKNKRWRLRPFGKSKNRNICALDRPVLKKFGIAMFLIPPNRQHIKFYPFNNSTCWPIAIWKIYKTWSIKSCHSFIHIRFNLHLFQQYFSALVHNCPPYSAFKVSFERKPHQIPPLGIRIQPDLPAVGFLRRNVLKCSIPATPPWLFKRPHIDYSIHQSSFQTLRQVCKH